MDLSFVAATPGKRVLIFGPTGYIGKYVTLEFIKRGYAVTAMAREKSGVQGGKSADEVRKEFEGAEVISYPCTLSVPT